MPQATQIKRLCNAAASSMSSSSCLELWPLDRLPRHRGGGSTRGPALPTWTWWAPTSTTGAAAPPIAVLGPPSPTGCRTDADRCRPSRVARGRVRRGAALLPDPGRPVPEGLGGLGQRLERRDQQDRDGRAATRQDFPPRLDAVPELDTSGALTRLWDHLKKGQKQRLYGWFQEWADIEAQATVLRWYEPLVVPGLLQTEEYARAILSARPDGNLDDLDEQVAARLARQAILAERVRPSSGASSTKASCTAPSAAARSCEASSTAWPK